MARKPPLKLDWSEQVAVWLLTVDRGDFACGVGGAIAITTKLMHAAQPDGSGCMASARWLERTTRVNATVVREFIRLLVGGGWLIDTGERRGRGGTPVYELLIRRTATADDTSAATADRTADKTADDTSAVQRGTADTTADDTYPTTDYRRTTTARAGDSTEADAEYEEWVEARTAAKGGGPGLKAKIHDEDRHIFDEGQRQKAAVGVLNECPRCDSAGWLLGVDGDVIVPTLKCAHGADPTPNEAEAILRAELGAEVVERAS